MTCSDSVSDKPVGSIALTLAYDGAVFSGFARQPGLHTVQGRIEAALAIVFQRDIETTGAGRTDAGVHALGQVMSFDADVDEADFLRLPRSLNALSGEGIVVSDVRRARPGFSARFDAKSRVYRYRIVTGSAPLFTAPFVWAHHRELDVGAMRDAATVFVGEHDFRSFCVASSAEGKRTFRRVDAIELYDEEHLGERCLTIEVRGNAFLHSMVRVMVGSLVEVGEGHKDKEWLQTALAACDRRSAGATAPACGLTLWRVEYADESWLLTR